MKNPLIIYHANCADGAGAALAAWLKFGDEAEYLPALHHDDVPVDKMRGGRDVYVLDFAYSKGDVRQNTISMIENTTNSRLNESRPDSPYAGKFVLLDHHKAALEQIGDLPFCVFDMKKSGAVMAWEYFHCSGLASSYDNTSEESQRRIPELFRYILDRDLWQWKLPHSREISAALAASGALTNFRKLICIYRGWNEDPTEDDGPDTIRQRLISDGAAILRAERVMIDQAVALAEEIEIDYIHAMGDATTKKQVRALAVTAMSLQSEIGSALAIEAGHRGLDPVGVVYRRDGKTKTWAVSLRSCDFKETDEQYCKRYGISDERYRRQDLGFTADKKLTLAPDVSAIALNFPGGGGHAKAAGFEVQFLPWVDSDEWCKTCSERDPYAGMGEDT